MRVQIPTPLYSYTGGRRNLEVDGATVDEALHSLDREFPGIRFRMIDEQDRIRPHMLIFVNREQIRDIRRAVDPGDEIQILQALSGG